MNKVEIVIKDRSYQCVLPASWDELTHTQVLQYCYRTTKCSDINKVLTMLALQYLPRKVSKELAKQKAYLKASIRQARGKHKASAQHNYDNAMAEVARIANALDWMRKNEGMTGLCNPLPRFNGLRTAALENLGDVRYIHYGECLLYYQLYCDCIKNNKHKDAQDACLKAIAALYFTKLDKWKMALGKYELVSSLEKRVKYVQKLHIHERAAIMLFIYSALNEMQSQFPRTFNGGGSEKSEDGSNYAKIAIELAGGKFGTVEQTLYRPLYELLTHIEMELSNPKPQMK